MEIIIHKTMATIIQNNMYEIHNFLEAILIKCGGKYFHMHLVEFSMKKYFIDDVNHFNKNHGMHLSWNAYLEIGTIKVVIDSI